MANFQEYTTRIFLNDSQAQDKIRNLRNSIKQYEHDKQTALSAGGRNGDKAWKEAERNIRQCETQIKKLSTTSQQVNYVLEHLNTSSVKDLKFTIAAINKQLISGAVTRGSAEWNVLTQKLREAKTELTSIRREQQAIDDRGFFSKMADSFNKNFGIIAQGIAFLTGLTFTIRKATNAYGDMDEQMYNVTKYTEQTFEQVQRMNEEFKQMDTRTARENLNDFASDAGKLGITAKKGIKEFVEAGNMIKIALADELGPEAVQTVGKLAMAFGEDEKKGLKGAMLATGSAINTVSQKTASAGGYLVDFASRMAGVSTVANMTQAQIIGLGSVMDENMQRDEMATTALSKIIMDMAVDATKFAEIAGINVKTFSELVKKDMNEALLVLAKTLQGRGGLMKLAPMFADMGLDGSRAVSVLTVLANKVDDVRKNQEIASDAYEKGTSILNEYNIQNNTTNAQIEKKKKNFQELSIQLGEKLMPVVKYTISSSALLVKGLMVVIDFGYKYRTTIFAVTAAILMLNAQKLYNIALTKMQILWNKKLWKTLLANPYTAMGIAIVAAGAAVYDLLRRSKELTLAQKSLNKIEDEANKAISDKITKSKILHDIIHDGTRKMEDRLQAVKALNKLVPEYTAKISKEGRVYDENAEALKRFNEELKEKALLEGAKSEISRLGEQRAKVLSQQIKAEKELKDIEDRRRKDVEDYNAYPTASGAETLAAGQLSYDIQKSSAKNAILKYKRELQEIETAIDDISAEYGTNIIKDINKNATTPQDTPDYISIKKQKEAAAEVKKVNTAKLKAQRDADKAEKAQLKKSLADLTTLYSSGVITYTSFLEKKKSLQLESIQKRKAIWGEESNEAKQMAEEEVKIADKYDRDMQRISERLIERQRVAQEARIYADYNNKDSAIYMNDDAMNEALFVNEMNAMANILLVKKKGSEEWLDIKWQMEVKEAQHQYELQQDYHNRLRNLRSQFGETSYKEEELAALNGLKTLHDKQLLSEIEYQEIKNNIIKMYASKQAEADAKKHGPGSKDAQFDNDVIEILNKAKAKAGDATNKEHNNVIDALFRDDIENWKNVNEQIAIMENEGVITHAQANAAKARNDSEYLDTLMARTQVIYNSINNVVSAATAYAKACSDVETAAIEKNYDRKIRAAGRNSRKREQLQRERDAAIQKARNKANQKAMKIQIAQAIATSAMSALDAYASVIKSLPYPANMAIAPVAAGLALASGALQIATIKKQQAAQAAGYYEGGFTPGRRYRRQAGIVHEGEFVANHNAVNNQAILPALELIDIAQRNNTVGSLTAADISAALGTSTPAPSVTIVDDPQTKEELKATLMAVNVVLSRLYKKIDEGIDAHVSIDGKDGVKNQLDRYNRLKKNV